MRKYEYQVLMGVKLKELGDILVRTGQDGFRVKHIQTDPDDPHAVWLVLQRRVEV